MISDESACDERREVGFGEAIGDRKRDESDDPSRTCERSRCNKVLLTKAGPIIGKVDQAGRYSQVACMH